MNDMFTRYLTENITLLAEEMLLLENRMEFLKKNFEGKLDTSHDSNAKHQSHADIVDHFAQHADPTAKKTHTQWILGQYQKKNIRQEDHPRIHQALSDFDTHKAKLEKKDINQYKKISDVEDAVAPHLGTFASKRKETQSVKHEGAEKVWEDDNISIHRMKTKEAACHYGKGTKWCTAAEKGNMFDEYHKDGPLHVIMHKKDKDESGRQRKWQYHTNSAQFMDERDNEINKDDFEKIKPSLHKAWKEKPELLD